MSALLSAESVRSQTRPLDASGGTAPRLSLSPAKRQPARSATRWSRVNATARIRRAAGARRAIVRLELDGAERRHDQLTAPPAHPTPREARGA